MKKEEYHKLAGLLHLAQEAEKEVQKYRKEIYKFLDVDTGSISTHIDDAIYEMYSLDEFIDREGIEVEYE